MVKSLAERQNEAALAAIGFSTSFNGKETAEKLDAVWAILQSDAPEDRLWQFKQEASGQS